MECVTGKKHDNTSMLNQRVDCGKGKAPSLQGVSNVIGSYPHDHARDHSMICLRTNYATEVVFVAEAQLNFSPIKQKSSTGQIQKCCGYCLLHR